LFGGKRKREHEMVGSRPNEETRWEIAEGEEEVHMTYKREGEFTLLSGREEPLQ